MPLGFQEFEPVFGEPKLEWPDAGSLSLRPFLFHVHAIDASHLRIHVTDFHSNTWESVRSVPQLEDMRDSIGIGGTWSEFIDYFVASVKSENVTLVLEGLSGSAASYAKLVTQKSKGMPRISIALQKLVDSSASEAMAYLSLELFRGFKSTHKLLLEEQGCTHQMKTVTSAEKEGDEIIQNQLDSKRQKLQKMTASNAFAPSLSKGLEMSPEKPTARDQGLKKASNRVLPAHRRAKVRGAFLQEAEDDQDT